MAKPPLKRRTTRPTIVPSARGAPILGMVWAAIAAPRGQIENDTLFRLTVGKYDERMGICRHKAVVSALIGYIEIFMLLHPLDCSAKSVTIVIAGVDAHDKAAFKQTYDRALEIAKTIDCGNDALA